MNEVQKIIYDKGTIVFLMKLGDYYWWWAVEKPEVAKYFNYPVENLSIAAANIYCNDEANSEEGCSAAGFETIEEAEKDYWEDELWTF